MPAAENRKHPFRPVGLCSAPAFVSAKLLTVKRDLPLA
jgi:hypothetical protein